MKEDRHEYQYMYLYDNGRSFMGNIVFHSFGEIRKFISENFPEGKWIDDRTYKVSDEYYEIDESGKKIGFRLVIKKF